MTNPLKPRIRKLAPKVRTGCKTCKRRRVKCDEKKPICVRCDKLGLTCEGYEVPKPWLFEPTSSSSESPSKSDDDVKAELSDDTTIFDDPAPEKALSMTIVNAQAQPQIYPLISIHDDEGLVLMQSYVNFAAECPVAWEADLYSQKRGPAMMTNRDIYRMHLNTPVTRVAHLAMATATLHLFKPEVYPFQLQLKYLGLAIIEVRKRIVKRSFDVSDLLHGISQIFLASVLIGDEIAARAHLKAAKDLVEEQGGIDEICLPTAHALKYGDLHLAVETVSPPVFMAVSEPELHYPADGLSAIDPRVLYLTNELRYSAMKEQNSLSQPLVRCLCNFGECAVALAHAWSDPPHKFDLGKLDWIATNLMGVFNILLKMSCNKKQVLTTGQEDTRHTLVLWIQLLCCMGNGTVASTDVRSNTIEVSNSVLSHHLSLNVRHGLMRWNHIIATAKRDPRNREDKADEDLLELIHVLREMEAKHVVRIGPLMSRLWELRRVHKGIKLPKSEAVEAFQKLDSGKFREASVGRSRSSSTVA